MKTKSTMEREEEKNKKLLKKHNKYVGHYLEKFCFLPTRMTNGRWVWLEKYLLVFSPIQMNIKATTFKIHPVDFNKLIEIDQYIGNIRAECYKPFVEKEKNVR